MGEALAGFKEGAEIERGGEPRGGERVAEDGGELGVQADGEDEREGEVEGIGPEDGGEVPQGEEEAMEDGGALWRDGKLLSA